MTATHWSYATFQAAPPATADTVLYSGAANPGTILRISHAHGNIESGSDAATERVFFVYVYHPNSYGAHFGDGQMLFLLDAVLGAAQATNSVTGGPAFLGTGFLSAGNTKKGLSTLLNGTHLQWGSPFVEVTEDMAVALHWVGPVAPVTQDTIDVQVDGTLYSGGNRP